ncbi:hypothetical protein ACP4OV_014767 [Aristida adscensionis]
MPSPATTPSLVKKPPLPSPATTPSSEKKPPMHVMPSLVNDDEPSGAAATATATPYAKKEHSAEATPLAAEEEPSSVDGTTTPLAEKMWPTEVTPPSTETTELHGEISSAAPPIGWRCWRRVLGAPGPSGTVLSMALVSLLYCLLAPWLLWRVAAAGQRTVFVWAASLLACSYSSIGATCLSETTGFLHAFFRISYYVTLLAIAGDHFVGPVTGSSIAGLATFYAAGTFGYAVGERDTSAGAAVAPPFRDDDQRRLREGAICYYCFMQGTMSLFVFSRMLWVVLRPASVMFFMPADDHSDEALFVVMELSLEVILLTWGWCALIAVILLEQSVVSGNTLIYRIPAWLVALYALEIALGIAVGQVIGFLVLWPVAMAMVGLLGYCLAAYARYKKIGPRDQPLSIGIDNLSRDGHNELDDRLPLV